MTPELAGGQVVIELLYLVASVLFILSLKWMSSPTTARHGIWAGEVGMVLAICGTLLHHGIIDYKLIAIALVLGTIIGVPLGIVVGRQLWTLFARNINAVPDPTVPILSVILVAVGALVFANLVAAIPGRIAAHTRTALVLRAE